MLSLLVFVLSIGLVVNCLHGLFSREGQLARAGGLMFWSQVFGIALGIGLACWSAGIGPGMTLAAGGGCAG